MKESDRSLNLCACAEKSAFAVQATDAFIQNAISSVILMKITNLKITHTADPEQRCRNKTLEVTRKTHSAINVS